jgi:glutathione S-transferase
MTESAAILIHLADSHPASRLSRRWTILGGQPFCGG